MCVVMVMMVVGLEGRRAYQSDDLQESPEGEENGE